MGKKTMNRHQKAARRPGEPRISREQIPGLLEMSRSEDVEQRREAANWLCPCHVKAYIPEVWEALYRMMEDADRRVRFNAWHTLEDGGVPQDAETLERLGAILVGETDRKIHRFAESIVGGHLRERREQNQLRQQLASQPHLRPRGKCDFCGATDVHVERDLATPIPTPEGTRAAWVCDRCA